MSKVLHFIIGDIHGCYKELVELEEKVAALSKKFNARFKILSVGDLIDRGPMSNKVVEHFIEGAKKGTHYAIMGNHESLFLNYLNFEHESWIKRNKIKLPGFLYSAKEKYPISKWGKGMLFSEFKVVAKAIWICQGGLETLASYDIDSKNVAINKLPKEHIQYLADMPLFFENKNFLVTHAYPSKSSLKTAKAYSSDKKKLSHQEKAKIDQLYWNRDTKVVDRIGNKKLISGHSPYPGLKKFKKKNIIVVDTWCFNGGRLTAYSPELDRSLSVKAKEKYY